MIEIDCRKCFYCNGSECTYYHTDNPNVAVKKCANDNFRNYLTENDMVVEFNGFTQGVIGKKLPADTTLNGMKKSELIELLHLAQHNYDTLMRFYTNAVNVNVKELSKSKQEIRDKVIDEFLKRVKELYAFTILEEEKLDEIAEQMKEVGELEELYGKINN